MAAHLHPRQGHILYMSSQYDTDIGTQEQFAKEGGVLMAAERYVGKDISKRNIRRCLLA